MPGIVSLSGTNVLENTPDKCILEGSTENLRVVKFIGDGCIAQSKSFVRLFKTLEASDVPSYFHKQLSADEHSIFATKLFPVSISVRRIANQAFAEKFGVSNGTKMNRMVTEWRFHSTQLGDPTISIDHIRAFDILSIKETSHIQQQMIKVFDFLNGFFAATGRTLGFLELRFGKDSWGNIMISDAVKPAGIELWELKDFQPVAVDYNKLAEIFS